jgi:phosphopantetheinyl transferase
MPLISKKFYGDYAEQVFVIAWGFLLEEARKSRIERQRVDRERYLEVLCINGATFVLLSATLRLSAREPRAHIDHDNARDTAPFNNLH